MRIPYESHTFDTFVEACSKHSVKSLSRKRRYRYIHRLMSERENITSIPKVKLKLHNIKSKIKFYILPKRNKPTMANNKIPK